MVVVAIIVPTVSQTPIAIAGQMGTSWFSTDGIGFG